MDYFQGNLKPSPQIFDFLSQAFQKLHPAHEAEFPSELLGGIKGRRVRVEEIIPTLRSQSDLKEIHDITEFLDPTKAPIAYILLHGFLKAGAKSMTDSSMLSVDSGENSAGFFKGPVGLRATLDNPLPVVRSTLYRLSRVVGVEEDRLPILSPSLILGYQFFVEEGVGERGPVGDRQ